MKKLFQHLVLILILLSLAHAAIYAQEVDIFNRKYPFYHHPAINNERNSPIQNSTKSNPGTPSLQITRCLGGSGDEGNFSDFMTQTSDGGFITCTYTTSRDGNVPGNHGGADVWVIKFNSSGSIQWKKIYGGSGDD